MNATAIQAAAQKRRADACERYAKAQAQMPAKRDTSVPEMERQGAITEGAFDLAWPFLAMIVLLVVLALGAAFYALAPVVISIIAWLF